jgi:hypothetical protein
LQEQEGRRNPGARKHAEGGSNDTRTNYLFRCILEVQENPRSNMTNNNMNRSFHQVQRRATIVHYHDLGINSAHMIGI